MKIILGSASKRRQDILMEMGYEFEIAIADIDERQIRFDDPSQLTLAVAKAKADTLAVKLLPEGILITADTVVVFQGKIIEKPQSEDEAYQMLSAYAGQPIETVTAVTVTNLKSGKRASGVDVCKVHFNRPFDELLINDIVKSGKTFGHAGGFALERSEFTLYVEKIEGTLESVMGLPKDLTKRLIEEVET